MFLIIVGAILRFAVTADLAGVDLQVVGLILMIGGVLGLVLGLWMTYANRRAMEPGDSLPPRRRQDPPGY